MTLRAHETSLLAIVRPSVGVLLDTVREGKIRAHRGRVDETVKVNPFPTIQ